MHPKITKLLAPVLGLGALGITLRLILYRVGFDEKNILSATHPLQLSCLALTAFMAVYLLLEVSKLDGGNDPAANFPESPLRNLGILAAACFTALHGVSLAREVEGLLSLARTVMAFGGAVSMALCSLPGMVRRKAHTVFFGVISVFFALDMLCRYQSWSGNPQLPDYCFQVPACVLLSLGSYHRLAFDTGLGKRRTLLFCSLMGLFLSLVCVSGPETRGFYLGGAFWAGSCMCTPEPPAEAPKEEENSDVPA